MPKYRKKPAEVHAEQFFPDRKPWPEGVYRNESVGRYYLDRMDLITRLATGDWIVQHESGRIEVVPRPVFAETYEPVEE
jgi:hypothetical protein